MQMYSWPSGNWSTFQKPHTHTVNSVFAAGQMHLPAFERLFPYLMRGAWSLWVFAKTTKFTNWTNAHIWDQLKGYLFSAKWLLLKYLVTLYAILIWPFQLSCENRNWIYLRLWSSDIFFNFVELIEDFFFQYCVSIFEVDD